MTSSDFVEKIKHVVYDATLAMCRAIMQKPPGKRPSSKIKELSDWYNRLPEWDKEKVQIVVELATHQSVFGMLAVLDGVRQVEDAESKGVLELRYLKNGQSKLINDPEAMLLHDIFNQVVSPV